MAKSRKTASVVTSKPFVAEINRVDAQQACVRIGDAIVLLDGLIWAADRALTQDDGDLVITLLRACLPSLGAALESANDALDGARIGKFVYSNDVSLGGAVLEVNHGRR